MENVLDEKISRFKDASWINRTGKNLQISVLGVGGIGSNTLFNLVRSIPATYIIVDDDTVDVHNLTTQFYTKEHLNVSKVVALKDVLSQWNIPSQIWGFNTKITKSSFDFIKPITITGFDNMEARKVSYELWKQQENREIFIDGRLRATSYEVYSVIPGREEEYEKTLFDDSDIPDEPCTMKQTVFFGMLIGARITNILSNYLTNKFLQEDVCEVPFKFKELGELCYVDIQ
ncbi:MAG: ThiF family adenylyltransferase [Bacteroidales bacterium]|jgi:molybdopterin/thiamine biosynthesis adenylyltransferase|nr:ThiF family adenylyltransferase [Bacteroidales bacterium]